MENLKFDFNDVLIVPAITSKINSRKDVNIMDKNGSLPIITSPMINLIDYENIIIFLKTGIIPSFSRLYKIHDFKNYGNFNKKWFIPISLHNFTELFINNIFNFKILNNWCSTDKLHIIIDQANGHMEKLINTVKLCKYLYGNKIVLMVGNIANPKTFNILSEAGADYIRVGIGCGSACTTTVNTGIGYPMASLINECYIESCKLKEPAMIVADGGINSYSDIIKSLALGADYVMMGGLFSKFIECGGDTYLFKNIKLKKNSYCEYLCYKYKIPIYKKFIGSSTELSQQLESKKNITTPEGVIKFNKIEYNMSEWIRSFENYLKSAMSYTNSKDLNSFKGCVEFNKITINSFKRYNK